MPFESLAAARTRDPRSAGHRPSDGGAHAHADPGAQSPSRGGPLRGAHRGDRLGHRGAPRAPRPEPGAAGAAGAGARAGAPRARAALRAPGLGARHRDDQCAAHPRRARRAAGRHDRRASGSRTPGSIRARSIRAPRCTSPPGSARRATATSAPRSTCQRWSPLARSPTCASFYQQAHRTEDSSPSRRSSPSSASSCIAIHGMWSSDTRLRRREILCDERLTEQRGSNGWPLSCGRACRLPRTVTG